MSPPTATSQGRERGAKSHAATLANLSPFSTLACQVEATNTWRRELKSLFSRASERFADVSWVLGGEEDETLTDEESATPSESTHAPENIVWAHKAILYARAPNTFQGKFLQLQNPANRLGALASSSTVSLPSFRAPSPSMSLQSRQSSIYSQRRSVRGKAPPSSYSAPKISRRTASYIEASDSEVEEDRSGPLGRRNGSSLSLASSTISRPFVRNDRHFPRQMSFETVPNASSPSIGCDSDALSVLSTTSTIKAPMTLVGVNQVFFESTLQYLYTAEENMKEAFEFLYEDRISADEGPEERLEKLRQDLVYMWRSRLYSDIQVVIGDEDERPVVGTIPDGNASVLSFNVAEAHDDEEEKVSFSAHRMMLVSRSPYFAAQLLSPYADANTKIIRLPSPPFTPAALHFTLGFIYTGTLFFSNRTFDLTTAFQLWRAASYLQIETLSTLVSSLITHDFCHGFTCSPPCKTCIRRVPKTLTFASSPDVSEPHLLALARNAASGPDFGSFWYKEIGNLDYAMRGSLVSDVCSSIDTGPGKSLRALRQLSIIGTRIDTERSSRWVESLRWMCETVESHICLVLETRLLEIVESTEWDDLIQGVGFLNDILEKAISIIVDGLTEKRAAKVYEILIGKVLLREDVMPPSNVVELVEGARQAILRYLRKRWVNVRALGGFNDIQTWALKELADEIDVISDELLSSGSANRLDGPQSRTGLIATVPSSDGEVARPGRSGQNIDGEREPGPIHLRAAVLNRNAARSSALHGFRSMSQTSAPDESMQASTSSSPRAQRSTGIPSDRAPSISPATTHSNIQNAVPALRHTSTASRRAEQENRTSTSMPRSTGHLTAASSSNTNARYSPKTPTASLRSVEREDSDITPTKKTSSSVAASRSMDSKDQRTPKTSMASTSIRVGAAGGLRRQPSENSIVAPSNPARRGQQTSMDSDSRIPRSRQSSASSVMSVASARKAVATARPTPSTGTNKLRKLPSSKTVLKSREPPVPAIPSSKVTSAILQDISRNSAAMEVDSSEVKEISNPNGTHLSSGIPCVVAPRNKDGKVTRFRAMVKYIGPVGSGQDRPMVGIEVPLPLPDALEELAYDFNDGSLRGVRYFDLESTISSPRPGVPVELSHKPEREARRLRLAQMLPNREGVDLPLAGQEDARPSAKRRKDLFGAGQDTSPSTGSQGLFIRPSEVLWVVI